jgi:hypothetical protein
MANAKDKREDAERKSKDGGNAEALAAHKAELQKQREALMALNVQLRDAADAAGEQSIAFKKAAAESAKVRMSSFASKEVSSASVTSSSGAVIKKEFESIASAMETASSRELDVLQKRSEYLTKQIEGIALEDQAQLKEVAEVSRVAISTIQSEVPKGIERKMRGVAQSTMGILDKSIGRNLLNQGMKLFSKTSIDEMQEAKKLRRELHREQTKALEEDQTRQEEALKAQIEQGPPVIETAGADVAGTVGPAGAADSAGNIVAGGGNGDAVVWMELQAEEQEKTNELLRDGLGVRSPGYLNDLLGFFKGDKLDAVSDKREEKAAQDAQLDALQTIADKDGAEGTAVVEAKGGGGGGLFGGIVKGFKGLLDLLKGIGSFIKDLITGLFDMIAKVMKSIGEGIGGLLKGIAKGLNAFKKESLIGAAAMVVVAGAVFVMAKALQQFSKVTWTGVAKGLVSLAALVIATKLAGGPQVIVGAAGLLLISGAMYVLSKAMETFNGVDWKAVAVALVTVTALGLVAAGLGAIAPIALLGAAAMLVIAGAMYVVAQALKVVAEAMNLAIPFFETIGGLIIGVIGGVADLIERVIGKVTDSLLRIASLDAVQLAAVSLSIGLIATSIAALGAALGAGGIMASIGEFFSWLSGAESPVDVLVKLAGIAEPLGMAAESIMQIVNGLAAVAKVGDIDVSDTVGEAVEGLNDAIAEIDEEQVDNKIKKLGELAAVMTTGATTEKSGSWISSAISSVGGMFDPGSAKKRMEEIQNEIRNKQANTASVIPLRDNYRRTADRMRGREGVRRGERADSFDAQILRNNDAVTKLTEELLALRALMQENKQLTDEQAMRGGSTTVINQSSPTVIDNSGDTFVAPSSTSNPRSNRSAPADIDAL